MKHFVIRRTKDIRFSTWDYEVLEYPSAEQARIQAKDQAQACRTSEVYYATSDEQHKTTHVVEKV